MVPLRSLVHDLAIDLPVPHQVIDGRGKSISISHATSLTRRQSVKPMNQNAPFLECSNFVYLYFINEIIYNKTDMKYNHSKNTVLEQNLPLNYPITC